MKDQVLEKYTRLESLRDELHKTIDELQQICDHTTQDGSPATRKWINQWGQDRGFDICDICVSKVDRKAKQ
jgi:hypothetical protein